MKVIITENQFNNLKRKLLNEVKKGGAEELLGLLELLPTKETSKYLANEIIIDLNNFYTNDIPLNDKTYEYHPEDKCLKPYELEIRFKGSNNMTGIGYASQNFIEIKYLNKESNEFKHTRGTGNVNTLFKRLYNIINHECGHFYLEQKGVEECLYNTHPDGMKKYYHDRQEIVLHSREIFDNFVSDNRNWKSFSLDKIQSKISRSVKYLRNHTNINAPFSGGLQKKYISFIMNNLVKPNYKPSITMGDVISIFKKPKFNGKVDILHNDGPFDWSIGANLVINSNNEKNKLHLNISYEERKYGVLWAYNNDDPSIVEFDNDEDFINKINKL